MIANDVKQVDLITKAIRAKKSCCRDRARSVSQLNKGFQFATLKSSVYDIVRELAEVPSTKCRTKLWRIKLIITNNISRLARNIVTLQGQVRVIHIQVHYVKTITIEWIVLISITTSYFSANFNSLRRHGSRMHGWQLRLKQNLFDRRLLSDLLGLNDIRPVLPMSQTVTNHA